MEIVAQGFNTLSELTSFFIRSRYKLYLPCIQKELSRQELKIFQSKINSMMYTLNNR